MKLFAALLAAWCAVTATPARAQTVPTQLHFQGRLTDAANNPLAGANAFIFEIFDAPAAGAMLWTETQPAVPVANGVFAVQLGSITPLPSSVFAGSAAYLQITVNGTPLLPRERLLASAYAHNAQLFAGRDFAAVVSTDAATQSIAGAKTFTGTLFVPAPTLPGHAASKAYVDAAGGTSLLTATNTWSGQNTFLNMMAVTGPLTLSGSTLTVQGDAFSVGGTTLIVTGGRVGVGAMSATSKLHVAGPMSVTGNLIAPQLVDPSNGAVGVFLSGDTYGIVTARSDTGTTVFRAKSSNIPILQDWHDGTSSLGAFTRTGRLGIATMTPTALLDVNGDAHFGAGGMKSTFTATPGGATYALRLSSGATLGGPLNLGTGGFIRFPDGTTQATAGLTAAHAASHAAGGSDALIGPLSISSITASPNALASNFGALVLSTHLYQTQGRLMSLEGLMIGTSAPSYALQVQPMSAAPLQTAMIYDAAPAGMTQLYIREGAAQPAAGEVLKITRNDGVTNILSLGSAGIDLIVGSGGSGIISAGNAGGGAGSSALSATGLDLQPVGEIQWRPGPFGVHDTFIQRASPGVVEIASGSFVSSYGLTASTAVLTPQAAVPTAETGMLYYDAPTNKLRLFNGGWVDLATGTISASGTDGTKVLKTGDTMTGQLTLAGSSLTVQGDAVVSAGGDIKARMRQSDGRVSAGPGGLGVTRGDGGGITDGATITFDTNNNLAFSATSLTTPGGAEGKVWHSQGGGFSSGLRYGIGWAALMVGDVGENRRLFVDYFGSVGIGTTLPAATLHVSSAATAAATPIFIVSSGPAVGQELLYVRKDGLVGIGTTSPQTAFDVNGDASFGAGATKSTFTALGNLQLAADSTITSNGTLTFSTAASAATASPNIFIAANGNVGIGTASPGAAFHVVSAFNQSWRFEGSDFGSQYAAESDYRIGFQQYSGGGLGHALIFRNGGGTLAGNGAAIDSDGPDLRFATSNGASLVSRMIVNGANVGIGTMTPTALLDVNGNAQFGAGGTKSTFSTTGVLTFPAGYSPASPLEAATKGYVDGQIGGGWSKTGSIISLTTPSDNVVVQSTLTVLGNAFSVGASSFSVVGGKVGVGTTGPTARLEVVADSSNSFLVSSAGNPLLRVIGNGGGAGGAYIGSGHQFRFLDSGSMGLGGVSGEAGTLGLGVPYNGQATSLKIRPYDATGAPDSTGTTLTIGAGAGLGAGTPGDLIFATTNRLVSGSTPQTLSTRMTVKGDTGSVGIGTTAPASKLHVLDGDIHVSTSAGQPSKGIIFQDGSVQTTAAGTAGGGWTKSGAIVALAAPTDNVVVQSTLTVQGNAFSVGASTLVVANGNIGIGTTNPGAHLEIAAVNPLIALNSTVTGVPALQFQDAGAYKTSIYWSRVANKLYVDDAALGTIFNGGIVVQSTLTVQGNAFSVGASSFSVIGGSVAIGVVTPGAKLDVGGSAQFGSGATKVTATAGGNLTVGGTISAAGNRFAVDSAGDISDPGGSIVGIDDSLQINGPTRQLNVEGIGNNWYAGNLGVGTMTVTARLHVSSVTPAASANMVLVSSGILASETLFVIKGDGKVGIGTSNPLAKLAVSSPYGITGEIDPNTYAGAVAVYGYDRVGAGAYQNLVVPGGNVGIGTTAPNTKLAVSGADANNQLGAGVNAAMKIVNTDANVSGRLSELQFGFTATTKFAAIGGAITDSNNNTRGDIVFGTRDLPTDANLTERMRIDGSGNVSIGTAVPGDARLRIDCDTAGVYCSVLNSTGGGGTLQVFRAAGVNAGSISIGGGPSIAYNTTSDRRLKENILDSRDGLARLLKLRVRDYNYKADPNKTPRQGFIAQELHEVYPEAVTVGGKDAASQPWGVDYGKLTPLLVKSVQELQAENAGLKALIEAMKTRLDTLEKR